MFLAIPTILFSVSSAFYPLSCSAARVGPLPQSLSRAFPDSDLRRRPVRSHASLIFIRLNKNKRVDGKKVLRGLLHIFKLCCLDHQPEHFLIDMVGNDLTRGIGAKKKSPALAKKRAAIPRHGFHFALKPRQIRNEWGLGA